MAAEAEATRGQAEVAEAGAETAEFRHQLPPVTSSISSARVGQVSTARFA